MKEILLTLLIGVVAGTIDILPMIKMNLDKHSVVSAFVFYLILPFIIFNTTLFNQIWWLKGGLLGLVLALPVIIIVAGNDIKSVVPIVIMSLVLGTLIGIAGHYIIK